VRVLATGISLLFLSTLAFSQRRPAGNIAGTNPTWPPPQGDATFSRTLPPGYIPESMDRLVKSSQLIIDGTVESTSVRKSGTRSLETDAVIKITRTLKGAERSDHIVVAQVGGVVGDFRWLPEQYSLFSRGDRYLLFLTAEERVNLNLPVVQNAPRYAITGAWGGLFKVEGTNIRLPTGMPPSFKTRYESADVGIVITDVLYWARQ
jgi:hypothetical protein